VMRKVSRRLERLEERAAAVTARNSFSVRILLVHPEEGLTGVLLLQSGESTIEVPATPEEVESVRADLERRRAGRK
jgi:hypothetical protein